MRANRYVSYLAAEIEPKAISTLNQYERLTEKTFARIEQLSTSGRARMGLGGFDSQTTRNVGLTQQAVARARAEIERTDGSVRRLTRDTTLMSTSFTRAAQAINVVQGPLGPLAGRLGALGSIFRELAGFSLAGVLAGGSAFAIGGIATSYQKVSDRLRPFYENQNQLNSAMNEVVGIAQRTRQALDPVAELYTKIGQAGRDAGIETSKLGRLTETVAKAARLSGGSAQTQEAGITQFAQGFGSGSLAGDELKSIRENTFRLAKAIADGLDLPISKLKELGSAGLLTPDLIAKALERSARQIDLEFSRLPPRIGASLTQAGNELAVFVGRMDEATGATTGFAKAINFVGANIPNIAAGLGTLLVAMNVRTVTAFGAGIANSIARTIDFNKSLTDTTAILNNRLAIEAALATRTAARTQAEVAASGKALQSATAARNAQVANVSNSRAYEESIRRQLVLLDQQIIKQRQALSTAVTLAAASRTQGRTGPNPAEVAARTALTNSLVARTRAEGLLRNAIGQTRVEEDKLKRTLYESIAARNAMAVAQARATVAARTVTAAEFALAAQTTRSTLLTRIATAAQDAWTAATVRMKAAASALSVFLGGPLGIALTVVSAGMFYLMTRTSQAQVALDNFKGGQEELARRLGITTGKLREQADAARDLALALAQTTLADAKKQRVDASKDLGGSLMSAYENLDARARRFAANPADANRLLEIAGRAQSGNFNYQRDFPAIADIQKRNPEAFEGGFLSKLFGEDPAQVATKVKGVAAAMLTEADAEQALADVRKELAAPRSPPPKIPNPKTNAELLADAQAKAAQTEVQRARAALAQAKAEGRQDGESDAAYSDRLAGLIVNLRGAEEAERAAAKARRDGAAASRSAAAAATKLANEQERARDRAQKVADIVSRFSEAPPLAKQVAAAKGQLKDLIGENVDGIGIFSQADFDRISAGIDQYLRKPIEDVNRESEQQLAIQRLILAGREDEADVLRTAIQLAERTTALTEEDIQRIRARNAELRAGNLAIEQRNRLVEIYARAAGQAQDAFRDALRTSFDDPLKGAKTFVSGIKNAFQNAFADEISVKLFGNAEQKARDAMTRSLNGSADRLTTSADKLDTAAKSLSQAAKDLVSGGSTEEVMGIAGGATPGVFQTLLSQSIGALPVEELDSAKEKLQAASQVGGWGGAGAGLVAAGIDKLTNITVTGQKKSDQTGSNLPRSLEESWNKGAEKLATKVFGANSPMTKIAGKLGTFMEGTAYGGIGNSVVKALGGKGSGTGASLGGGLGNVLGKEFLGKALGSFAGPLGSIAGSIIGGVIGGAFKKTKTGTATVTSVDTTASLGGNSKALQGQAGTLADNVQNGILRIAEALGGTTAGFNVSIGVRDKNYRVDTTGSGITKTKKGAVDFGQDADAAVRYAILDAIQDGAVQGIREGAQQLLKAGKDLDAQLDKALKFENVFRRLKAYTDPVGAAVDDVNREFTSLIKIFQEAGASAAEFADLEKLYGYEREAAIKNATNSSISALQDFINGLKNGPDSPLGRSKVYDNAKAEVDKFRADIAAGKAVDNDKLISALEDFQAASRTLNGSRGSFFVDFNDILALAEKARDNVSSGTTTNPLPGSPFDNLQISTTLNDQLSEAKTQTDLLDELNRNLQQFLNGIGGGTNFGSSLSLLPGYNQA